jgi:hypothetical protein
VIADQSPNLRGQCGWPAWQPQIGLDRFSLTAGVTDFTDQRISFFGRVTVMGENSGAVFGKSLGGSASDAA